MLLALLFGITVTRPAGAQPQPPRPQAAFGERVEVSVVNVEVYVTDRKGEPVLGLTREDFLLFEDGEPVPVANFFAVETGREAAPAASGAEPAAGEPALADAVTAAPASPPPERQTSLVIYVDNVNLQPASRKRAFRSLREFLAARLEPGTPVMVVSYERSLNVPLPFTAERAPVDGALAALERAAPHGVEAYAARRNTLALIRSTYDEEGCAAIDRMLAFAQAYARPRHHDVRASLSALTQLADSLAGLPGRKVLLHVSDGIPLVAGQEMFELIDELCPTTAPRKDFDAAQFRADQGLRRLTTRANADGVTLYTLEAAGLQGLTGASADMPQATLSARMDFNAIANHQDTLFNMADETGGRALLNSNRLDRGLAKVAADLANYYSLGFSPRHHGDGREHALAVRVRREGVEVRHRKTYRDKPATERAEDRLHAALILGQEENPLGASLEAAAAAPAGSDGQLVPVRLRVPFPNLVLLPAETGSRAQLRLLLVARDERGGISPVRRLEVPILVPQADLERALARDFVYEIKLQLRPGGHRLALAVEDTAAATTSYLALDFQVPGG